MAVYLRRFLSAEEIKKTAAGRSSAAASNTSSSDGTNDNTFLAAHTAFQTLKKLLGDPRKLDAANISIELRTSLSDRGLRILTPKLPKTVFPPPIPLKILPSLRTLNKLSPSDLLNFSSKDVRQTNAQLRHHFGELRSLLFSPEKDVTESELEAPGRIIVSMLFVSLGTNPRSVEPYLTSAKQKASHQRALRRRNLSTERFLLRIVQLYEGKSYFAQRLMPITESPNEMVQIGLETLANTPPVGAVRARLRQGDTSRALAQRRLSWVDIRSSIRSSFTDRISQDNDGQPLACPYLVGKLAESDIAVDRATIRHVDDGRFHIARLSEQHFLNLSVERFSELLNEDGSLQEDPSLRSLESLSSPLPGHRENYARFRTLSESTVAIARLHEASSPVAGADDTTVVAQEDSATDLCPTASSASTATARVSVLQLPTYDAVYRDDVMRRFPKHLVAITDAGHDPDIGISTLGVHWLSTMEPERSSSSSFGPDEPLQDRSRGFRKPKPISLSIPLQRHCDDAEFLAVLAALRAAKNHNLLVLSDSQSSIDCCNFVASTGVGFDEGYVSELRRILHQRSRIGRRTAFVWVNRECTSEAHELAARAKRYLFIGPVEEWQRRVDRVMLRAPRKPALADDAEFIVRRSSSDGDEEVKEEEDRGGDSTQVG